MKRKTILIACLVIVLVVTAGIAAAEGMGPAPDSGDCIPVGSGFESPNGEQNGPGPAPNSGDGIPDGPGWE